MWGGDHTPETIGALVSASIVLIATVAGRFAQAYAIYRDSPRPAPSSVLVVEEEATTYMPVTDVDLSGEEPTGAQRKPTRKRHG